MFAVGPLRVLMARQAARLIFDPPILPRRAAGRGPAKSFSNSSTILPRCLFTLVKKQRFYEDFVKELWKNFVHAKFGKGFSSLRLFRI
jgi:hypothetical protein